VRLLTLFVRDKVMNPVGIGPVCFDRDEIEILAFEQCLGDLGPDAVELRRAVARLADQY
jgi:hypothetical protein